MHIKNVLANMKLKWQIALVLAISFVIFLTAISTALSGARTVRNQFVEFLDRDLVLADAVGDLYAQGLQMGQAIRNVVMDPTNKKAFENLGIASAAFEKSKAVATSMAYREEDIKVLAEISALRDKQKAIQERILGIAERNRAGAIELINKEETPVWRSMRERLVGMVKAHREATNAKKSAIVTYSQFMQTISLSVTAAAVLLGIAILILLTRSVMRKLGGEPNYAIDVAGKISQGDLSSPAILTEGDTTSLLAALSRMQEHLSHMVVEIRDSSDSVGSAARQISAGNNDLSQRTQEQASALEETASSMEEMTSTTRQSADNARQANQLAMGARDQAEKGGAVVTKAIAAMSEINTSSKKIADIIGVIDEIAFQTNLLALNAAVEAARAGEQGRGFAVVASEVRNLAQRSAAAAKEIKGLINDSVEKVKTGSELVDQSGNTLTEIVASVKKVTDIVAEIATASQEQSSGIEQVNKAVMQMDEVTQQNAALVEEAAVASKCMEDQAAKMVELMGFFKTGIKARAFVPAATVIGAGRTLHGEPPIATSAKLTVKHKGGTGQWQEFRHQS